MTIYDSQAVLIVFGSNLTGRVRTEGTHFVVKSRDIVNEFCLVQVLVQELHDLVADFHADTDIDGSDLGLDAVAVADM